jgi:cell division protein FtsL
MTTLERIRENEEIKMPSRAEYYNTQTRQRPLFAESAFGVYTDSEEIKQDLQKGNPDILPSRATLRMLGQNQTTKKTFDDEKQVSFKVNSKGKLLFSLYAVVVLSLILIIVLNAVAIERQTAQNEQINAELAQIQRQVDDLSAESENLLSASNVIAQAESYGMEPVDTVTVDIDIPSPAEIAENKPVTNWFDWLCGLLG